MDFNLSDIGSHAALSFFRKRYPYKSTIDYPYKKDQKKLRTFRRLSIAATACALFYFFTLPLFYTALFAKIIEAVYRSLVQEGDIYFSPTWIMYILTAVPFSFGTLLFHYELTFKVFLQSEYKEFEDYYNNAQGYDNHKAGLLFSKPFLFLALVAAPFTFSSRIITHDNAITIKMFYDVTAKTHLYTDVSQIVFYHKRENRAGVIKEAPHYQIHFKDGARMNPLLYFNGISEVKSFVEVLSKRSGVRVDSLGVEYF